MPDTPESAKQPVDVNVATPDDRERVLHTIVRAFEDDPFLRLALPDDDEYVRYAPEFFGTLFDRRVERTTVWLANNGAAVALWDAPDVPLGADPTEGLPKPAKAIIDAYEESVHEVMPTLPHWYLGRARDGFEGAGARARAGGAAARAVARGIRGPSLGARDHQPGQSRDLPQARLARDRGGRRAAADLDPAVRPARFIGRRLPFAGRMVDMSLNIKNERTHALVRELATLRGVSQTEAVDEAVRLRLEELNREADAQERFERTMAIAKETGAIFRATGGPVTTDDLYDELGLPK